MKTTIDAAGRLVIPKELRRRAGIQPGSPLDVRWHDGRIEIEPAAAPVDLERKGRFLVAVPLTEMQKLTAGMVEEAREDLREERSPQARS
ncbi:MAG: AbrB/MazE/SpoVT family DNA-binding domain-containing protein [Chloroflexota bacterium]